MNCTLLKEKLDLNSSEKSKKLPDWKQKLKLQLKKPRESDLLKNIV